MYFRPYFLDCSDHNSPTTFDHMETFIHCMYDSNLIIKYSIIYDTIDIFRTQYRCKNSMYILSVLLFTHILILYRCINAPGHGRSIIDVINGAYNK